MMTPMPILPSALLVVTFAVAESVPPLQVVADHWEYWLEWGRLIVPTIAVIVTWLLTRYRQKIGEEKLTAINVQVDGQTSAMMAKIATLEAKLNLMQPSEGQAALAKQAAIDAGVRLALVPPKEPGPAAP